MTKDMTTGAITPLLVKFTIPLVLGNLFQLTYNAAESHSALKPGRPAGQNGTRADWNGWTAFQIGRAHV